MSFIQRELDQINAKLRENPDANDYDQLYAAQQALSWAMEPTGVASPLSMIRGIPAGSEGCLADPHPLPS